MKLLRMMSVAVLAAMAGLSPAAAQSPPGGATVNAAPPATALSAAQRTAATRELVARWRETVRSSPGGNVARWSARLASAIATADPQNVLRATAMPTFELMHAALDGHLPTTAEITAAAAPSSSRGTIGNAAVAPQSIGSTVADLAYTPLPLGRCRIADSRVISNPLPALGTRNLYATSVTSYASQGGSGPFSGGGGASACGLPDFPAAYAVSVTLVNVTGSGVFKIFPYNQSFQTGASSAFNAGSYGASENMIVTACAACSYDISVYTSTQIDYVVDIIGYFMPPQATALSCVETAETSTTVAAGATINVVAPACTTGYTQTATNCAANSWLTPFVYFKGGTCSAKNNDTVSATVRASRTCCRVPGR